MEGLVGTIRRDFHVRLASSLTPLLPDSALRGADHGLAGLAAERLLELGHVRDDAVDAELAGGVRVDGDQHAIHFGAAGLAPDLAPAEEETLAGGEAVDLRGL